MKSSGHKTSTILLTLVTGVCLAASQGMGAESTTSNSTHKAAPHVVASHTTASHSLTKKAGATTPSAHSATQHRAGTAVSTAHHTAGNTAAHHYSTASVKGTPVRAGSYTSQHKTTGRYRSSRPSRSRTPSSYQRLARLHLEPERVQEIQHALISQGYMQGEPSGEWDTSTRDAMLRYQTMHGFPPTGLPEAKSLMKLGLGPHPLSPELDHGQVTAANAGVTTPVQNVFTRTPNTPPDAPSSPADLSTIVPEPK